MHRAGSMVGYYNLYKAVFEGVGKSEGNKKGRLYL